MENEHHIYNPEGRIQNVDSIASPKEQQPVQPPAAGFVTDEQGMPIEIYPEPASKAGNLEVNLEVAENGLKYLDSYKKGTVQTWNSDRGFGFVELEDGTRVFMHINALTDTMPRGTSLQGTSLYINPSNIKEGQKGLKIYSADLQERYEKERNQREKSLQQSRTAMEEHTQRMAQYPIDKQYLQEHAEEIWSVLPMEQLSDLPPEGITVELADGLVTFSKRGKTINAQAALDTGVVITKVQEVQVERGVATSERQVAQTVHSGWENVVFNSKFMAVDSANGTVTLMAKHPSLQKEISLQTQPTAVSEPYHQNGQIKQKLFVQTPVGNVEKEIVIYAADPTHVHIENTFGEYDLAELQNKAIDFVLQEQYPDVYSLIKENRTPADLSEAIQQMEQFIRSEFFNKQPMQGRRIQNLLDVLVSFHNSNREVFIVPDQGAYRSADMQTWRANKSTTQNLSGFRFFTLPKEEHPKGLDYSIHWTEQELQRREESLLEALSNASYEEIKTMGASFHKALLTPELVNKVRLFAEGQVREYITGNPLDVTQPSAKGVFIQALENQLDYFLVLAAEEEDSK